jgi:N-acetylglucosamine kinase-like BadF-type ATPase
MSAHLIFAVDGGNSKTDLVLARSTGDVLALVRGPQSSPHSLGVEGCADVLQALLADAVREAGLHRRNGGAVADVAQLLLAGVDFPDEVTMVRDAISRRAVAGSVIVLNDTFAVLRAGTERGWGVAVVCGSGINCLGVAPDGRHARFPALGRISGDWGGGQDVGLEAVFAAARSEDGRGPATTLQRLVPAYFGLTGTEELAVALHRGHVPTARLTELAPLVFEEAPTDDVAGGIVARLADEVAALVRVALARLDLAREAVEVLLGGGLFQSGDGRLVTDVAARVHEVAPTAVVRAASSPPIVGAALLALDALAAPAEAAERLRRELGVQYAEIVNGRSGS